MLACLRKREGCLSVWVLPNALMFNSRMAAVRAERTCLQVEQRACFQEYRCCCNVASVRGVVKR
jgi:hypothetical protein